MPLELTARVFTIFAALVEERAGLHYELLDREALAHKIVPRAVDQGFTSLLDYYYFLRYDDAGPRELDALIELLLVQESYLFREADQLAALADTLAGLVAKGIRPRVWCAACAGGEEAVTLAILLAERALLGQIDLVASDLGAGAIARARRGVYVGRALRALEPETSARWFERQGDAVIPSQQLRDAIRWDRVNLVDRAAIAARGSYDAILCRNVLIYFRDATARDVVASLTGALVPGGRLLVGASETLLRFGSGLRCEEVGGAFFYAKQGPR